METSFIEYHGARLEIPTFLVEVWPYEFTLKEWPTFCGAGDCFGDKSIPDSIYLGMATLKPACFIHDICWGISRYNKLDFYISNSIFYRNLKALTDSQLYWPLTKTARIRCRVYYGVVSSPIGWMIFRLEARKRTLSKNPFDNQVVLEKLTRLYGSYNLIPFTSPINQI